MIYWNDFLYESEIYVYIWSYWILVKYWKKYVSKYSKFVQFPSLYAVESGFSHVRD